MNFSFLIFTLPVSQQGELFNNIDNIIQHSLPHYGERPALRSS